MKLVAILLLGGALGLLAHAAATLGTVAAEIERAAPLGFTHFIPPQP